MKIEKTKRHTKFADDTVEMLSNVARSHLHIYTQHNIGLHDITSFAFSSSSTQCFLQQGKNKKMRGQMATATCGPMIICSHKICAKNNFYIFVRSGLDLLTSKLLHRLRTLDKTCMFTK